MKKWLNFLRNKIVMINIIAFFMFSAAKITGINIKKKKDEIKNHIKKEMIFAKGVYKEEGMISNYTSIINEINLIERDLNKELRPILNKEKNLKENNFWYYMSRIADVIAIISVLINILLFIYSEKKAKKANEEIEKLNEEKTRLEKELLSKTKDIKNVKKKYNKAKKTLINAIGWIENMTKKDKTMEKFDKDKIINKLIQEKKRLYKLFK